MTREDTYDTDNCDKFHELDPRNLPNEKSRLKDDDFISWKHERNPNLLTQEETIEWLLHQPHCKGCLQHNNSYLFAAWYDISKADVENVAELLRKYYPANLQQPIFFAGHDGLLDMRLPKYWDDTEDTICDLDLATMKLDCSLIRRKENDDDPFFMYSMEFDLSRESGWNGLLKTFPQNERNPIDN